MFQRGHVFMNDHTDRRATGYAPQVVLATTGVALMPVLLVWALERAGVISSPWTGVAVALGLSLAASVVGSAYWKRRRKPGDLLFSELLVWGWLRRLRVERQLADAVELLDHADTERVPDDRQSTERKVQILERLAAALEAQDRYTRGHSRRVASHSVMVARRMGLPREEVARIRTAAAAHDVGKIYTPTAILNKPGRLNQAEFEVIKRHAEDGAALAASLRDPELTAIVLHHHERFDGSGYPAGLRGEAIPLGARVIAVADTFDAITSARPYRPAVPHKQAIEVLTRESRARLDPAAVRAFLSGYSGKRAVVLWALLASSPQRALARLRGNSTPPSPISLGDVAATAIATAAIGAAAVVAAIVAGAAPQGPGTGSNASSPNVAAARNQARTGLAATGSQPTASAASSMSAATRRSLGPSAGGVSAATRGPLRNGAVLTGSHLGQASPSGSSGGGAGSGGGSAGSGGGGAGSGGGGAGSGGGGAGSGAGGGAGAGAGGGGAGGGSGSGAGSPAGGGGVNGAGAGSGSSGTGSGSSGTGSGSSGTGTGSSGTGTGSSGTGTGSSGTGSGSAGNGSDDSGNGDGASPGSTGRGSGGPSVGASVGAGVGGPGPTKVGGSVGAGVGTPGSHPIGGSAGTSVGGPSSSAGGSAGASVSPPGKNPPIP
jgi:HD domain